MASRDTEVGGRTGGQRLTMALNRRPSFVILEGVASDAIVVETGGICRWEKRTDAGRSKSAFYFKARVHSFPMIMA